MRQCLQVLHGRQHDNLHNVLQSEGCALTATMKPLLMSATSNVIFLPFLPFASQKSRRAAAKPHP